MQNVAMSGALASALLLGACAKDSDLSRPSIPAAIDLTDPAVGQTSYYIRINLAAGDTLASTHHDTISLRVTAVHDGGVDVEESLTTNSGSLQGRPAVAFPTRILSYRLSPKPAGLAINSFDGRRLETRLFPQLDDRNHELGYGLKAVGSAKLAGFRLQVPYLPRDREYRLESSDQDAPACILAHAGRDEGLPGYTFVHSRTVGLHFMLVEHDLAGEASGWLRIESPE